MSNSQKLNFVDTARLEDFAAKSPLLRGLPEGHCLTSLRRPDRPLSLLVIEDFDTPGLDGDHRDPESAWFRFLLSIGDSGKTEQSGAHTGGSYGYGKTALSSASRLATIVAYTRFRDGDDEKTRLMDCAYLDAFSEGRVRFTGRAWLGRARDAEPGIVDPLENEGADRIAAALSAEVRGPGRLGTTVVVVDPLPETTPEGIVRAVETWWWPRLLDGELDLVVVDASGKELRPAPVKRTDLEPYRRSWTLVTNKDAGADPTRERKYTFNRLHGKALGTLALVAVASDDPERNEQAEDAGTVPADRVALVRFPKMVVQYFDPGGRADVRVAGAFKADDDIDDVLRLSEPPEHDKWEPTNRRLPTEEDKEVVRTVVKRIKDNVRKFRREVRPPPPEAPRVVDILSRELAEWFSGGPKSPGGTGSEPPPISIRYESGPRLVPEGEHGDRVRLEARIAVALAERQSASLPVRVAFACPLLEEEHRSEDEVALEVEPPAEVRPDPEQEHAFVGELGQGQVWHFELRSEPYEADWSVLLEPKVEVLTR
ncbi:MAG: hypothetical protein NZ555_02900 [Geminicoccaceae bacterium]|nr:hypothetical protein [Geminicoccaceae bacterium]